MLQVVQQLLPLITGTVDGLKQLVPKTGCLIFHGGALFHYAQWQRPLTCLPYLVTSAALLSCLELAVKEYTY